jgi:predicted dehydrogenase
MKLRVGLVGLGAGWENCHRPALRALADRYEVRAICTHVSVLGEQAASEFDASTVDGFRALTQRPDVDAVLMLSPEPYGPLPIFAAAERGKAVYCAAPLEFDLASAREMKQRVEESGVAFMAEFPRRNSPATLRLKELIATRLGAPRLLFCHARNLVKTDGAPIPSDATRTAAKNLMEMVDWCRYVVDGDPSSVIGVRHHSETGDHDDYQMMSIDFSNASQLCGQGPLAHISTGRYLPEDWKEAVSFRPPAELQVCCERGVAFVDLPYNLVWFDEAGQHRESLESERPVGEQMLNQFHRAVTSLVRKTSDLEDAYRAVRTVLEAQRSFDTGQRVAIDFS